MTTDWPSPTSSTVEEWKVSGKRRLSKVEEVSYNFIAPMHFSLRLPPPPPWVPLFWLAGRHLFPILGVTSDHNSISLLKEPKGRGDGKGKREERSLYSRGHVSVVTLYEHT